MTGYFYHHYDLGPFIWLTPLIFIDLVLKGFALWKAAKHTQSYWFIALLLVNSLGILPVVYMLFFQYKNKR